MKRTIGFLLLLVVAIACASVVVVLAWPQGTIVLNDGQRYSGTIVYHHNAFINLLAGGRDTPFSWDDVAVISFSGSGPSAAEVAEVPAPENPPELERHLLVMNDGRILHGKMHDIFEDRINFDTRDGQRLDYPMGGVVRLYINRARATALWRAAQQPAPVPTPPPPFPPTPVPGGGGGVPAGAPQYLGCWTDDGNRVLNGFTFNTASMTIDACVAACRDRGFAFAGLQYSSYCFCGNSYNRLSPSAGCNMPCSGNPSQTCGGSWANSVYAASSAAPPPFPPPFPPAGPGPAGPVGGGVNIALNKPAMQSSRSAWSKPNDPQGGVDGVKDGRFGFHTENEANPWWQVDLQQIVPVREIRVFNRLDCCSERVATLQVLFSIDGVYWQRVYAHDGRPVGGVSSTPLSIFLNGQRTRYVRLQLNATSYFHLDEVEIYP